LSTLVRYQTAVGRELTQADDAIKQMAERSRISDEGEQNADSMPLPEETEIPNSEGADIAAVPNLTERTQ
jgi:hypothetical protein